jgi:hypothetical protein
VALTPEVCPIGREKSAVSTIKNVAIAAAVVFALAVSANAQSYHPGQTIRIAATFEGPDAAKVTCGNFNGQLTSVASPNQPSFQTNISSTDCKQTAPGVLELDCKIPDTQASGTYELRAINIGVAVGPNKQDVGFTYNGSDVPSLTFKIDNENTTTKPKLKKVTVLP